MEYSFLQNNYWLYSKNIVVTFNIIIILTKILNNIIYYSNKYNTSFDSMPHSPNVHYFENLIFLTIKIKNLLSHLNNIIINMKKKTILKLVEF